jgi:hypothetical protein
LEGFGDVGGAGGRQLLFDGGHEVGEECIVHGWMVVRDGVHRKCGFGKAFPISAK